MGVIYKNGISYGGGGSGSGGTDDYEELTNKPSINGVSLIDGLTTDDLDLVDDDAVYVDDNGKISVHVSTSEDINALFP